MRIYIIGNAGSGKTTLAHALGKEFNLPVYSTDDIFWERKFDLSRPKEERIALLNPIARSPSWIIEGTSTSWTISAVRRADIVIELKTHRMVCIGRALRRSMKRFITQDGSRESLLGVIELCKYIWDAEHPRKEHSRKYRKLMHHATGHRITVRDQKDLALAKATMHLVRASKVAPRESSRRLH